MAIHAVDSGQQIERGILHTFEANTTEENVHRGTVWVRMLAVFRLLIPKQKEAGR
jgi:hypothetical protein